MKDSKYLEVSNNPVEEARRYVDNARKVLVENGKLEMETMCYEDDKYVRAAGNYLWYSVLIMLDAVFNVKTSDRPHPDIKDYKEAVRHRDKKLLTLVNAAYATAHITMGYDGNPSKETCNEGFRLANSIIDRCASMLS